MATVTIRNLEDALKTRLRVRAAEHGRSMEEEARIILRQALLPEPLSGQGLVDSIRAMLGPEGGVELELPVRTPPREPPDFGA